MSFSFCKVPDAAWIGLALRRVFLGPSKAHYSYLKFAHGPRCENCLQESFVAGAFGTVIIGILPLVSTSLAE